MKKKLFLMLTIITAITFFSCNKDEDTVALQSNPIIGTWKLVEEYSNNQLVVLNNCNLQETYIFGEQQFTHEAYSNTGKMKFDDSLAQKGGDDDDDDDHGGSGGSGGDDDDDDDDHGPVNPNPGNGGGDDDDDDDHGGNGSGTCVLAETVIGYWANAENAYHLTSTNITDTKNIIFTDNGNKFYYEKTTTVNGVTVTKKYVFKRQ